MVKGYSTTQIGLHWATGLLIVYNLIMSDDMSGLYRQIQQTGPQPTTTGAWLHIIVGVLVIALALWRLTLRMTRGVPDAPAGESAAQKLAAGAVHGLLYILMFALPITGLVGFYGGLDSVAELHGGILKALMWVLIAGHVAAAFYHHFVLKNGLLNRMRKPG